jgi:hypothetical protein
VKLLHAKIGEFFLKGALTRRTLDGATPDHAYFTSLPLRVAA